jgi:hypothetical protein
MKPRGGDHAGWGSEVVLLSGECRPLRRSLRPLVWVILEEVALDAVVEDGRLVARTSARQVAEHLGINPSTAAEALRVLGRRGLVSLEREKGPAGRFGLSVYQLRPVAGLCVLQPCTAEPFMVSPSMMPPDAAGAGAVLPCAVAPHVESSRLEVRTPGRGDHPAVGSATVSMSVAPDPDRSRSMPGEGSPHSSGRPTVSPGSSQECLGQTALDLGVGSS